MSLLPLFEIGLALALLVGCWGALDFGRRVGAQYREGNDSINALRSAVFGLIELASRIRAHKLAPTI